MGACNFYTSTDLLNLASFPFEASDCDEDHPADIQQDDYYEWLAEIRSDLEDKVSRLSPLFFHSITVKTGYYEGFQVYVLEDGASYDTQQYWVRADRSLIAVDSDAWDVTDKRIRLPLRKNMRHFTHRDYERAKAFEYKRIEKHLLEFARERGLGEVCGKLWTQSVRPLENDNDNSK